MFNLQELTGCESGIVIYGGESAIIATWTEIDGLPRVFETGLLGLGEDIPEVESREVNSDEIAKLLAGVDIIYSTCDEVPTGGRVYEWDDVVVICPTDWC